MNEYLRKQLTIDAIEKLIFRYKYPTLNMHKFLDPRQCPLCKIHKIRNMCRGCPLANIGGSIGCIYFKSFKALAEHRHGNVEKYYQALHERGKFFEKILPMVQKHKRSMFTDNGWQYFSDINRDW